MFSMISARWLHSGLRAELIGKRHLLTAGGWIVAAFVLLQILRLGTNIGMAHLLAPQLLGVMALINTLRTGGELLTDIGIGQSIVNSRDGDKPHFYNTAWTLQILRGFALFGVALLATYPLALIYDDPLLAAVLPVAACIFVITGLYSPARFLLQKRIAAKRLAAFQLAGGVCSTIIHLVLAWYLQTIWALVFALLLSAMVELALSFCMLNWRLFALRLDRNAVWAIVGFGKWVFLSTLVFFFAGNFDRLYLADMVPFAVLGVYGIARTFADTAMNMAQHLSSQILFPKVSGSKLRGLELRAALAPPRRAIVWIIAAGMAFAMSLADWFIYLAYDERYHEAAFFLSVLLAGGWFGMLSAFSESVLMGIGKPSNVALGNICKLAVVVAAVPFVLPRFGMGAAVMVFAAVEGIRYLVLAARQRAHGLSFWRQDVAATAGFVVLALLLREVSWLFGITSGIGGWVAVTRQALGF